MRCSASGRGAEGWGLFGRRTEDCLAPYFAGARETDVLFVGSTPCNTSLFGALSHSLASFEHSAPAHALASAHADHEAILKMLLRVFPGAIIWHSFPHLVMRHHRGKVPPFELNRCYETIDHRMRCAARQFERVRFLDLRHLQQQHNASYRDFIHHPGLISDTVVRQMLSMLRLRVE